MKVSHRMNVDSWAALKAWQVYAEQRFGGYTLSCSGTVREAAREAFITEFLVCRGWREEEFV